MKSIALAIFVLVPAAVVSESCKTFANTNFAGHDLSETDENTAPDCCTACEATAGCGFWTFIPPTTCQV